VNVTFRLRLALFAGLLLIVSSLHADNWPQWRGPENNGICTEKGLPTTWSATENIAWKFKLPGQGSSTPAIWGSRIFLTCEDGSDVVCLCVSTAGKELWKSSLGSKAGAAFKGRRGRDDEGKGNIASPSPSTDGKNVYCFAGNGQCAAFDFTGKEIWRFDVQKRYGQFRIQFGMHSTPALFGDRLYFQLIHSGVPRTDKGKEALVVAIDTATGKEVWKVVRASEGTAENEHSYASPFVWKNGKNAYLVVHGNDYATAHSLEDGKELWRVGDLNVRKRYDYTLRFVASPVCTPDLIVIPSAKRGPTVGLKPDAEGKVMIGSKYIQWRFPKTPDVSSPLVYDGLVYLSLQTGDLLVLDAKTGEQVYEKTVHSGRHRASPVYADSKVYMTARDGTIGVVQAGREFKLLAKNQLLVLDAKTGKKVSEQTAASPAISGGRIYVRGYEYLWAIEGKK
jgi:outer membrane protein assembly factor BamB